MNNVVKVTLPNGAVKEFASGVRLTEVAEGISRSLAKDALVAKVNGKLWDLNRVLEDNAAVEFVTFDSDEGKYVYWHSTAHLMAQAVKILYPEARVTIGPPISDGFYYDFDFRPFTPEDLTAIEKKMEELAKEDFAIQRKVMTREEALQFFKYIGEDYKVELLKAIPEGELITFYSQGAFIDLCRGPHVPSTKYLKAFKLISIAGAYWRGDEKNKQLQRIYGTSYPKKAMLDEHLNRLEEAKKRDHRKLGKELGLFSISNDLGGGLVLWHPKGALIRHTMETFWKEEHLKNGYELLYTPHIARRDLWKTSGHLDYYTESMYSKMDVENVDYQLKPMNCPFHIMIYKNERRSYRDLPFRWAELGTVYRFERSGVLHGLMRVRGFTQDDAHLFCRADQLDEEIQSVLHFTLFMLRSFGFENYDVYLSTRPEKYVGSEKNWELATDALRKGLEGSGLKWKVDTGEGVFYGPKIDIKIKDVLGRAWQCSTIQVDFNLPERFDLSYVGSDGADHQPIMIHRALLGSLERFFGVLIEHYAGAFPLWLCPVQVAILPITDRQLDYAKQLRKKLNESGLRVEIDDRNEKVNYKIRESELKKIPYMLVVGDREVETNTVAVRKHGQGDLGVQPIAPLITRLQEEVVSKK